MTALDQRASDPQWSALVGSVQEGNSVAIEKLYQELGQIRFFFARTIGYEDHEDAFHKLIVFLLEQIQQGKLREPERLVGYARSIAARIVYQGIRERVRERKTRSARPIDDAPDRFHNPEALAIGSEHKAIALRVLRAMPTRDRELLSRFYLREQSQELICKELGLTHTQFRLLNSRAKQRFEALCQAASARRQRRAESAKWSPAVVSKPGR